MFTFRSGPVAPDADLLREMHRLCRPACGAGGAGLTGASCQKPPDRLVHLNGYRDVAGSLRAETVELRIPAEAGSYVPCLLDRCGSPRTLTAVIQEAYV